MNSWHQRPLSRTLWVPEPLEPRCLLATIVVNQIGDSPDFNLGDGVVDSDAGAAGQQVTLRAAIQNANLDATVDNIHFNIPGGGVKMISPTSALPTISQPVVIDGYTQPGAAANTQSAGSNALILIQLNGTSAGAASGLSITAGGSTVRGLSITRFSFQGIEIEGPGNFSTIVGNFLGVPPTGDVDQGNTLNGVLIINSAGNVIGGASPGDRNVISGNNANGVALAGTNAINNIVAGNYIGTNAAGAAAVGNSGAGVIVSELTTGGGEASHTIIGGGFPGSGNLISGNLAQGVAFLGPAAQFNDVRGNIIGLNVSGTAALGNGSHGVLISFTSGLAASNNTIGGVPNPVSSPFPRNIISGNGRAGVGMFGAGANGNKVQGNYIGTDITGTLAIPNANDGVRLGDNSLGAGPSGNFIGGTAAGAGNLISGNMDNGIELAGAITNGNAIQGNLIGTIVGGSGARPNERMGILIDGAKDTVIGGTAPGARNVISGNGNSGIHIKAATATGNRIEGNYIGVTADGVAGLSNQGSGVYISENASGNTVGGSTIDAGNVIAYNIGDGVTVGSGTRNAVRLNSIRNNNGLGIDLNFDGETLNDQDDADAGPNDLQNWPEIVNFTIDGLFSKVTGFFEGKENTTYTLDFYSNNGFVASNLSEGQEYLSTETLTTDANGYVKFTYTVPLMLPLGKFVTVTATDPDGNTSEFSHDADTDGLYDHWESGAGVDGNGDGTADFFLNNPNPFHKDVYVEVDAMGVINTANAGVDVTNAFATKASALNALNPDGQAGVTLHFELDPNRIPQQSVSDMATLRAIKQVRFGTVAENSNLNSAAILAAKRMTHRYAVYGPSGGPKGGESWLYSHEFYVSLGPASRENLATGFMHELGHALNLHHGGGDGVNYKPNYHSILNYLWTFRSQNQDSFRTSWELNYSNSAFNTLDENNLLEAAGIGGHPGHMTKVGPLPGRLINESGPVNWNGDGDMTDVITTGINLNGLAAPGVDDPEKIGATTLFGHNDWANLFLNFRHSLVYRLEFGLETGASEVAASEHHHADGGPTPEIVAALDDIGYTNRAVRIQGLPDLFVNQRELISFTVPASDPEGDALSFSLSPGAPPNASIHSSTGLFTWQTNEGDGYGEYIVTVRIVDAGSGRAREHNYGFAVLDNSADFDSDDDIDGADFLAWQCGLGTPSGALLSQGDADHDGNVDRDDLDVWRSTFALPAALMSMTTAPVAESASVNATDFSALAGLWPGADVHRTSSGGRTARPGAVIAAEARAVAFARFLNIRGPIGDEDDDLSVAGRKRIENGVNLTLGDELFADRSLSLSAPLRRRPGWVFSSQPS